MQEGAVGAGTGTIAFSWKGGIGTSSRKLPANVGGWTVGVLVQTNYGGVLQVAGVPVGQSLGHYFLKDELRRRAATDRASSSSQPTRRYPTATSSGSPIGAFSELPAPVRR